MTRGGIPGAIAAWAAFTLPSAIIMLLAAYGVHWVGQEQSWLHGLKVVAVAVVAQAVWSMATKLCTDRTRISFAFVAAVIVLLTNSSWVQVLTIALGALAGWKLIRAEAPPERSEMFTRHERNQFSEELGPRSCPFCRVADLEDRSLDTGGDRRRTRWTLFVRTRASLKIHP